MADMNKYAWNPKFRREVDARHCPYCEGAVEFRWYYMNNKWEGGNYMVWHHDEEFPQGLLSRDAAIERAFSACNPVLDYPDELDKLVGMLEALK